MLAASITALMSQMTYSNAFSFSLRIAALAQVGIILFQRLKGSYETALKYMILGSIASPMMLLE